MLHKKFECTFYFIRHAESERNLEDHLVGGKNIPVPLSARGKQQAIALGERLHDENILIDYTYTSPTQRAYDTAAIALPYVGYPLDRIVKAEELNEIDQGDWEGAERKLVYNNENMVYIQRKGPTFTPPNGESQQQVERRAGCWLEDNFLYNNDFLNNHNKATVAVFSHAITLKAIFHYIMGFDRRFIYTMYCDNASISEFVFGRNGWHPKRINDTSHLSKVGYILQKF